MAFAPGTASAPPSQKSFCISTTISTSLVAIVFSPSRWRDVSFALFRFECGDPVAKCARLDRGPQAAHNVLIVVQIVPGEQHGAEHLLAAHEMVQIGAAMMPAGRAGAALVERTRIVAVARVAQVDLGA